MSNSAKTSYISSKLSFTQWLIGLILRNNIRKYFRFCEQNHINISTMKWAELANINGQIWNGHRWIKQIRNEKKRTSNNFRNSCQCWDNMLGIWWKYDRNVITSILVHVCINHPICIYTALSTQFRKTEDSPTWKH